MCLISLLDLNSFKQKSRHPYKVKQQIQEVKKKPSCRLDAAKQTIHLYWQQHTSGWYFGSFLPPSSFPCNTPIQHDTHLVMSSGASVSSEVQKDSSALPIQWLNRSHAATTAAPKASWLQSLCSKRSWPLSRTVVNSEKLMISWKKTLTQWQEDLAVHNDRVWASACQRSGKSYKPTQQP